MRLFLKPSVWIILSLWLSLSGFTFSSLLIPRDQIFSGGPPKDGIPALNNPRIESIETASQWLDDDAMILGIVINGRARAYPLQILNWHEIVNDCIDKHAFVVTYCPLCGSGMVFDSSDQFGVSGLLYQSDVLLYDRKTESLWSQLKMQAVAGPRSGERLKPLVVHYDAWKAWRFKYPKTDVLSRKTGFQRDYARNPYAGYEDISKTFFPVNHHDPRLPSKTWVIALSLAGQHKAWPFRSLIEAGSHQERWGKYKLGFEVDADSVSVRNVDSGELLPVTRLYWFAWSTFHPDTELSGD